MTPAEEATRLVERLRHDLSYTAPELYDLKLERFRDELEHALRKAARLADG